ncbi:MAG TPA: proton-conducting transporter membrane subunit, partial [Thermoleophilaceae bacterium]|nr:proton-conducting transporter membrane subunit [Thermoleophilaceae bacterium]
MNDLAPLAVAVPLLAAGVLAGTASIASRWFADIVSLATAAAVTSLCAILLAHSGKHEVVYWFGGWHPRKGVALGIGFAIDPLGAGLATFTGAIMLAALAFSWHHLKAISHVYHALMLAFLAGMVGFCLTGDLFNLFVFFELLSVAAYALVGYKIDQRAPLEGSLNFAITNSVGGFMVLMGIALLYGRTGALNMAQIGETLAHQHADGLVVIAFTLLVTGFFVKAAVVPFHFWLPDAYSVAPTPVCAVLSAVMSELGLYAVARIWWTCFHGSLGVNEEALRTILLVAGAVTALVPAVVCFAQTHLKRMLAYATVSYIGLFLIGLGLLSHDGLGGTAVYLVGDGFVKAGLFVCVGIVQHRKGHVDEYRLQGQGRELPYTAAIFVLGALALASLPPFGTFLGKSLIEDAAVKQGEGWVIAVFVLVSAITGGAVLRSAGRVFLGLGPEGRSEPAFEVDEETETETREDESHQRTPLVLFLPAVALVAAALGVGIVPGLPGAALRGAAALQDRASYVAAVLHGAAGTVPHLPAPPPPGATDYVYAGLSVVGACV